MASDNDPTWTDVTLKDRRAFAASEMIECPGCARANPPTRGNCFYCNATLDTVQATNALEVATTVAEPEQGSLSQVVVVSPKPGEASLAELGKIAGLTTGEVEALFASPGGGTSICAVDSTRAELICERLRGLEYEAFTVEDERLKLAVPPKDLRTLELTGDSLVSVGRRDGDKVAVNWDEVILIVVGRLHAKTVEVDQKRRGSRTRTLDERELLTDEALLDIYVRNDEAGWRVKSGSFDFSCLEENKSITAFHNFAALTQVLRERAGHADFDDTYNRLRPILTKIWPVEEPEGTTERRRTATRDFHATKTSSNNLREFTRYSRLRRFLKARASATKA